MNSIDLDTVEDTQPTPTINTSTIRKNELTHVMNNFLFSFNFQVIAWVLSHGVLTYVKVSIAAILCRQVAGQRNLFWFGVSTQIGSAVGSVIAFVLVNVLFLFQSYYPCA